jgi:hypothetical protein
VRWAVQFDDELALKTDKIGEIPVNWDLSPKLEPAKASASQHLPEDCLGPGIGLAKAPGGLDPVYGVS